MAANRNLSSRGPMQSGGYNTLNINKSSKFVLAKGNKDLSNVPLNTTIGNYNILSTATSAAMTGSEQDLGVALSLNTVVNDAYLYVNTAEATGGTKTLTFGTLSSNSGGVAAGFLNGVSTATLGFVQGLATYGTGGYITGSTYGSLLRKIVTGSSTSIVGRHDVLPYMATSNHLALELSATAASSDWVEGRFTFYVVYFELGA